MELQELYQRRHGTDRNHHHGTELDRYAVFEVFQVTGKIRTDLFDLDVELFDLIAQRDLQFLYIPLEVGDVSFRGAILFDQLRLGIGEGLGLFFGEPGLLEAFGELEGIEGS